MAAASAGASEPGSGTSSTHANGPEGAGPQDGSESGAIDPRREYRHLVRRRLERALRYPDAAKRMGWEGTTQVAFRILADGSVSAVRIVTSSGIHALDQSALRAVKDAAPFPRPPGELELAAPIDFKLE